MPVAKMKGTAIRYEVVGSGSAVLMIQGVGAVGGAWAPQVEGLAQNFQCLTFDNRGIGASELGTEPLTIEQMASDALALMDRAGWDSAHVVGHSMGGLIAQQVALERPARVRSLSLLCTFSKGPEASRISPAVVWMGIRSRIGTRAMRRAAFVRMLFPPSFLQTQEIQELAKRTGELIGRDLADTPAIVMKQLGAMRKYDRSADLGALGTIPTLVIAGREDPIALPKFGKELSARISGSRYMEVPDAAHGVMIQAPALINSLLRAHFAKADEPAT